MIVGTNDDTPDGDKSLPRGSSVVAIQGGGPGGGEQALTRYQALYESLRSRRRKPESHKGLDLWASQAVLKAKNARVSRGWLRNQAQQIEKIGATLRNHSDRALDEVVREVREVFVRGREDHEAVRRGLAVVREVARRETGQEAYTVQLMGALGLYHGRIVEMATGEGKTLTGSLAAPLVAWKHTFLHVLTVNDYLASRDAESRAPIFRRCGCDVGAIVQSTDPGERPSIYAKAIVFGTPKQITADWLRDQLKLGDMNTAWAARRPWKWGGWGGGQVGLRESGAASGAMIPGLHAALVDEADAVLIDEGVVPLIIARARREDDMATVYAQACEVARRLDEGADYKVEHLQRRVELTRRGSHRCAEMAEAYEEGIWRATRRAEELVRQALVARHCYLRGHQYEIVDGRVVIVDEYTGRFLADRSWEHGLHQAVEAKEGLEVTADRETLARLSFQRFFRMYPHLGGMTGTAADAAGEMERVYQRPVTVIPTHQPVIREHWPTRVFKSSEAKWTALIDSIQELNDRGRPVLVGSRSIEISELISSRLSARGIRHRVLNANFDKEEAELIALAGKAQTVTVATNMAGRGTDIEPDDKVLELGGLHVILSEMHTAKRVDRQFIGRAGRQGDPGSAQTFVSLEDELVRHYTPRAAGLLKRSPSEELRGPLHAQAMAVFRFAQRRAEARARRGRTDVLRQDDWIDQYMPGR